MASGNIVPWKPALPAVALDTISDANELAKHAIQLRKREQNQITANFAAGNYEMVATYIWSRTMALLKKQLSALGSAFIGELLQRADIDEHTDIQTAVSETEAISLARDLGMITPTQTMRLLQSQTSIAHFSGATDNVGDDEQLTQEEAILCLRVCVQGVLSHESIGAAEDFHSFRKKLTTETFTKDSAEISKLRQSPYFFVRTAISVLLSLFKSTKGAQLEHVALNAQLIIPLFWKELKEPERWQVGQTYAVEFNEGRKESLKGLHTVLLAVKGFDYVPENLRSATFIKVASSVIAAHQGMNNFYNEPAPMAELASLGTSIPGPALAKCMTAVLCVKLGNSYGVSHAAQSYANEVLKGISADRWLYYLNGRLGEDLVVLSELHAEKPTKNWLALVRPLKIREQDVHGSRIRELIRATNKNDIAKVQSAAMTMYRTAVGVG
jgi:hypothetical protein